MPEPTRQIVVDDTDSRIEYSGPNWVLDTGEDLDKIGVYGPIYNHTSHGTSVNGTLSFSFSGSSISAFGTILRAGTPSWECFVDQVSINNTPPFSAAQNNWILCEKKALKAGPHILSIQIVPSTNDTFWFDYLRYTPLPNASFSEAVLYVPSQEVNLTSNWEPRAGVPSVDDAQIAFQRGSTATFEFVGTQVAWYGWLLRNEPLKPTNSTIVIDGKTSEPANFTVGNTPPFSVTHPNVLLFQTHQLAATQHKLVVNYLGDTSLQSTPLSLNYLLVTITSTPFAPSDPPSSTTPGLQSLSSTSSSSFSSQSASSTPQPLPTTTPQAQSSFVGIIVGSIIGGLALVAIILGLCVLQSHRRYRRAQARKAQPFTLTQPLTFEGVTDMKDSRGKKSDFSSSSSEPAVPHRIKSYHKPPLLYNGSATPQFKIDTVDGFKAIRTWNPVM